MDAVAEGLWVLAEELEKRGEVGQTVKCLEAICQSKVSFLPMVEIKTRLRLAQLLLDHTHNLNHAKAHLERAHLLLKSIPSCFELKCRAHSLLSHCYHLTGAIPSQKLLLHRALDLVRSSPDFGNEAKLWSCNFNSQLASALAIEGDYGACLSALESGYACATEICSPELQMFFATSMLHVRLFQFEDGSQVGRAVQRCTEILDAIHPDRVQHCLGLFFYKELLHTFYLLRIGDLKSAFQHVEKLDAAMKDDLQQIGFVKELTTELDAVRQGLSQSDMSHKERSVLYEKQGQLQEQLKVVMRLSSTFKDSLEQQLGNANRSWIDKLQLAPPPINEEWLPKGAVYALVDLMAVIVSRPKGMFKECGRRIQSGLNVIQEVNLQHSAIWTVGVYLMLLMQFLENKVAVELTRSEFVEAQEALVQMKSWFIRFPTILPGCESIIEMLRGQYAHSLGCFNEAAFHFIEAKKLTDSKSMQSMCHVYAALSFICIGDAESTSQALDLIGPVYRIMDSFAGVREKTCIILLYGLLLTKKHNLQEARTSLASGLKIAHQQLGNIQLVSQYLTILGALALQLRDTGQAREILKSSLTLAKTLYDIPTQIWVLSVLTDLYKELGERGNEMENNEYERKKEDELQKRLSEAQASHHHLDLIEKARIKVQQPQLISVKMDVDPTKGDLEIPESICLPTPPASSSSRLRVTDSGRRPASRSVTDSGSRPASRRR